MKNKLVYLSVLFCTITLLFTNCTKAGLGGKSEIKGYAYYNNKTIKPTTFYIKYGATTSPGSDLSKYDASSASDSDGKFDFKGLQKGDYFIYANGVDNYIIVTGGVYVKVASSEFKDNVQINVTP